MVVTALALAPLAILAVRRIFPGRNVVFARWGFSHVAWVILLAILLLTGAHFLAPLSVDAHDPMTELLLNAVVLALASGLVFTFAWRLAPERWRALGLWPGRQASAVAAGLVAYLACLPGILGLGFFWPWFLEWIGAGFEPQKIYLAMRDLPREQRALAFALGALVMPLFEELLFRVFLQPLFVQNFSEKGGILLTSLVFAALHGAGAFLPIFGLSLVLGAVMLRTQRLLAVWSMHALHNAILFAALWGWIPQATDVAGKPGWLGLF